MQLKTAKNKPPFLLLALLLLGLLPVFAPQQAFAYIFTQPSPVAGPDAAGVYDVCPGPGLTRRLMPCLKETVLSAAQIFINSDYGSYMTMTIFIGMTLAIAFWGFGLLTGHRSAPKQDFFMTLIKIGGVVYYFSNFGYVLNTLINMVDDVLGVITNYATISLTIACDTGMDGPEYAIWDNVDCAINTLIGGIFSGFTLTTGVLGFFTACIFSNNPIGLLIALTGFYLIAQIIIAIGRAMFVYVTSFVALSLLVIISPFFVPLILFNATKEKFDKWLRLVISFMLQPVILFAYLVMLLAAFDATIYGPQPYSIATALTRCSPGPGVSCPTIGDFLYSVAYSSSSVGGKAINIDPGAAARNLGLGEDKTGIFGTVARQTGDTAADWQNDIYGFLGVDGGPGELRFFQADLPVTGVDWDFLASATGQTVTNYIITLCISLLMAAITAYIFRIMLDYIPYISSGLSENSLGMNSVMMKHMQAPGGKLMNRIQDLASKGFAGGAK